MLSTYYVLFQALFYTLKVRQHLKKKVVACDDGK